MDEESSSSIHIEAQQPLQTTYPYSSALDMNQVLKSYSPINPILIYHYDSELDFLRSISGFREFVEPGAVNFNYYFDENSYATYTKEQFVMRLELTKFRQEFVHEMTLKHKDLMGYYYEIGEFQTERFRPTDYDDGTLQYKPQGNKTRQSRRDSGAWDRR